MLANYIDGRFVEASGSSPIPVINPRASNGDRRYPGLFAGNTPMYDRMIRALDDRRTDVVIGRGISGFRGKGATPRDRERLTSPRA